MPAKDGTGPQGEGSMTGRGMGNCSNTNNAQPRSFFGFEKKLAQGRGLGLGRGKGFGRSSNRKNSNI